MKPHNRIAMFIMVLSLACISSSLAQDKASRRYPEKKPRQVWIRLKSGPILTGDLVKMDPESVDFIVKGVLQSIPCDDLIGVMFLPPTTKPTSTPTPTLRSEPSPFPVPDPEERPRVRAYTIMGAPFVLKPGHYLAYPIPVDLGRSVRVEGRFEAEGGGRNDIEVYIFDEDGLTNFKNNLRASTYYNSGRVAVGSVNVVLPPRDQGYYLVFSNIFSVVSPKAVKGSVAASYIGQ